MKEKGLYLRGETWWISYAGPNGEDVRESSKSGNPDVAKRLLKKRHQHVQNERDGIKKFTTGKQERVTLGELLDALEEDYKLNGKREGEQWRIENVRKALGGLMARSITTSRLRAYATSRQKDGAKPATISRELEFVGAAYALAIKDERLSFAPHMPELVIENVRTRFPTDDEAADVLEEIRKRSPAAYDFYLWISNAGMRPKGMGDLEWRDLDRARWELTIRAITDKSGNARVIPIDGVLREIVERRWKARLPGAVFIFTRDSGKPLNTKQARQKIRVHIWNKACLAVGIKPEIKGGGLAGYDLKRYALRNRRDAGQSEERAMIFSGHKTTSTFRRYAITTVNDLRQDQAKVDAYVSGKPVETPAIVPPLPYKRPYKRAVSSGKARKA